MIIDFHTHVFPDKIAEKTVAMLHEKSGTVPSSDGTVNGLLKRMAEADADICVTLPVMTSPTQFDSITRFASELNERFCPERRRIISFAGIHPACEDIDGKMRYIRSLGFLGVKIHPDYQGTFINDESYIRIFECAREYDLIVVTHSGVDAGFRDQPVRCTPERALDLITKVPHSKTVFAHLGASMMPDEVIDKLAGQDVYFDTAYCLKHTPPEKIKAIIARHGADRILFASDSPWSSIEGDVKIIRSLGLDKDTEDRIFYKNALSLLGIKGNL